MSSSSSNVVGVHYRVGKKIGEGSFGVIFEGTNLLNNQQVAIKFVRPSLSPRTRAGVQRVWDRDASPVTP
jgi:serine/threonine protein kinase